MKFDKQWSRPFRVLKVHESNVLIQLLGSRKHPQYIHIVRCKLIARYFVETPTCSNTKLGVKEETPLKNELPRLEIRDEGNEQHKVIEREIELLKNCGYLPLPTGVQAKRTNTNHWKISDKKSVRTGQS